MNKTIFLGLAIGVIAVAMITLLTVSKLDFIVMARTPGAPADAQCTSTFFTQTCCWNQRAQDIGGVYTVRVCQTCVDGGDGTFYNCKTVKDRTNLPDPTTPGPIFDGQAPTPGPAAQDQPQGPGIFQGDIIPTPGPAAQDQPQGPGIFQGDIIPTPGPRGGVFQGNLLESYSQPGLIQTDPDSETPPETNATQPGGSFQDLGQLGATQDNETTSRGVMEELPVPEENMTAVPPATEETQPATVEEEPAVPVCQEGLEFDEDLGLCVPTECPEGQELDEATGLCVLEESQAAEQPEEESQAAEQPEEESQAAEQPEEENQGSENNGSEGGGE